MRKEALRGEKPCPELRSCKEGTKIQTGLSSKASSHSTLLPEAQLREKSIGRDRSQQGPLPGVLEVGVEAE